MASCAASPTLGCGIGYVRFSRRGDWVGAAVELRLPDGSLHKADVVTLPFFDQGKNIVRGLDREVPPRPT
jgi:glycine cleavage system aminomethyltransferase T